MPSIKEFQTNDDLINSSEDNKQSQNASNNLSNIYKKKCITTDNNISKKNTNIDDDIIKTNQSLMKLRDWLISCDLISYYNLLRNNSLCDIDKLVQNLRNNKNPIQYKDVENFGIQKPGHIFRFLLKLDIDANIMDYDVNRK